jgi:spore maturation protein CgeB
MPTAMPLTDMRRALWHLRHGGPQQVRTYLRRRTIRGHEARVDPSDPMALEPWPVPTRAPARPGLRVGVILDDFSRTAYAPEWDQVPLRPSTWRTQVEQGIDLLFVESAWHGNDDAWQYALTGPSAPRADLVDLVAWCREAGVPTVFWNKEDPSHYADFLETARLFDHVWTTDSDRLEDYRRDLGHHRVGVLPFAAQPAIHNPVRPASGHQARDIAFAGMYFAHRHPERREQMDLLLGAAARVSSRMPHGLEIFSRYLGGDERYQFPGELGERVVGSLSYDRMLTAYRAYKVFLNVNSVVGSPSMCARRIFEITASGTPVVSTPSPAIGEFFAPDEVPQVGAPDEAEWTLRALVNSPELRDRMVHSAQRRIWRAHTYSHRVDEVLRAAGLGEHVPPTRSVSALVSSNRPDQLDHVVRTVAAQQEVDVELVLLTHGFEAPKGLRGLARELGLESFRTLSAPADVTLGGCLNRLVEAADAELVTKMDDDDLYGPHYLRDQLDALAYSGADVVGKQAHHMYLEAQDVTVVRFPEREHRFTDFVMGPTMMTSRDLAREYAFADVGRGEDTDFLRRVVEGGSAVYSCDRFGFVQIRSATRRHTWGATSAELLANSRVLAHGRAVGHAVF